MLARVEELAGQHLIMGGDRTGRDRLVHMHGMADSHFHLPLHATSRVQAALYKSMKGDVSMIRALARLRFCGPDCHIALTSLLGDPAVPLDEIRWLLEGDGGGGGGGEAGAEGGAAGPSEGPTPTAAPKPGPAASLVLRDEALWQQVLEAAGRRGQGQAAGEVRAWLEGWRQANMKPPGDSNERWQGPRARAEGSWGGWKHRAADDTWQFCIT